MKHEHFLRKLGFLLVNQYGGRGGVENILIALNKSLKQHEIEMHLFYTDSPAHPTFLDHFPNKHQIENIASFKKNGYLPKFLQRYFWKRHNKKLIKEQFSQKIAPLNLDAMIIINLPTNAVGFNDIINLCKQKYHLPFISWLHGSLEHLHKEEILYIQKSLSIFDYHIAICKGIQKQYDSLLNRPSYLIYNPIPPANIVQRDASKILYIGRIDENKRVRNILQLLSTITSLPAKWSLDIIGSTGSADKDLNFSQLIYSYGLEEYVTFHGWQESPWDLVDSAGILWLNSLNEGFGLVLAEAMMRGIAGLSSNCPVGPDEIIQDGTNGWLYPPNEEDKALKIIIEILTLQRSLPQAELIQKSVGKFHIDTFSKNFISYIDDCTQSYNTKK